MTDDAEAQNDRERLLQLMEQLADTHAVWRRIAHEDRTAGVETTARSAQIRADTYAEVVHRLCAALQLEPPAEVPYPYPRQTSDDLFADVGMDWDRMADAMSELAAALEPFENRPSPPQDASQTSRSR